MAEKIRITSHLKRVPGLPGQTVCIVYRRTGQPPSKLGLIAANGEYTPPDLINTLHYYMEHKEFDGAKVEVSTATAALLAIVKTPQEWISEFPKSLLKRGK